MAVAKGVEHVGTAACRPDDWQAVRRAGPVPHPHSHPFRRQVPRQVWERAQRMVAQDGGTAPVWRRIEAGQLDLPGDTQSGAGHRDRHLAVAGHDGMAEADAGRRDNGVVAALGLQAYPVPGRAGQRAGPCAGGDHRPVAYHLAQRCRHRFQPARLDAETGRRRLHPRGAERGRMARQRRDIGAGIGAVAAGLDQCAKGVAPVELGLLLAQLVPIQLQPLHPVVPAQLPRQGFRLEIGAARKNIALIAKPVDMAPVRLLP